MSQSPVLEMTRIELLNAPPVWVLALVLLPLALLFVRWLYRDRAARRTGWLPATLRLLVIALLALFLMHPVRLRQKVAVERPVAVALLDDSASLRERDMPELAKRLGLPADATRAEVVRAQLAGPLASLEERYELLTFAFGDALRAVLRPRMLDP